MARMNVAATLVAAAAATVGSAAPAAPADDDGFCYDLDRVIRTATNREPFVELLRDHRPSPTLGFTSPCRIGVSVGHPAWICSERFAPDPLSLPRIAQRTASCLPQANETHFATWLMAEFTLPHVRIRISQSGGPASEAGRRITYSVEATDVRAASPAPSDSSASASPGDDGA